MKNFFTPRSPGWMGRASLAVAVSSALLCALTGAAPAAVLTNPTLVGGSNAIDPPGSESIDASALGATPQNQLEAVPNFGAVQGFSGFASGTNYLAFSDPNTPDVKVICSGLAPYSDRSTSGSNSAKIYQNANSTSTRLIDFGSYDAAAGSFDGDTNAVRAAGFALVGLRDGDQIIARFVGADATILSEQTVEIGGALSQNEPTSGEGTGRDVYFGFDSQSSGISKIEIQVRFGAISATRGLDDIGFAPQSPTQVRYVTPGGAGAKTGLNWENAYPKSSIVSAWNEVGAGGIVYIGSGSYSMTSQLTLAGGGEAGAPRKIIGVDRGSGLPVFTGNWSKSSPSKGINFLILGADTNHCWIENLVLNNFRTGLGFSSAAGARSDFTIRNVDMNGVREGVLFAVNSVVTQVSIEDCDLIGFTKHGVRFQGGASQVTLRRCVADAGGQTYATEPFQMGFHVNAPPDGTTLSNNDHDISFEDCTARNSYWNTGTKYWQGDGFVGERDSYNIHFLRCRAFDNTDGGWDIKSDNITLTDCVALRNKRNYRIWGTATLTNCVGAYATKLGGSGTAAGLWTSGQVTARFCTFHDNGIEVHLDGSAARLTFEDSIASKGGAGGSFVKLENSAPSSQPVWTRTARFRPGVSSGEGSDPNPQYHNAISTWEGGGNNFDSQFYGLNKGYNSAR